MADLSAIKLPNGTTYNIKDTTARSQSGVTGVKGNAESSYRTGQVNLTAANVQAIKISETGNTQQLARPLQLNGCNDNTLDAKINTLRANRLAFLPADQIIIEKTTDGGTTWTDAGVADSTKTGLFSETRAGVSIPLLNGVKNTNCGLRITFTAMKYNVPSGTAETSKYNYWNSNYIASTERYNQLKEMYFWVSSNSDSIGVKVERATGAASTNWVTIFDNTNYGLTGWSGNDYIRFSQSVFGGGTTQTGNYWNYRLTFFTRGPGGSMTLSGTNTSSSQSIFEIRGYGDTWWTAGNEYAANDKIYTHDYLKNVTFPAKVTASGGFSGNLTGNVTGNVSGSAGSVVWTGVTGKPSSTGSATTGISIAAHGTGTVIGVQSSTTTASKVTIGSHSTDYGVTAAGSASSWTFEEKTIPNVTSAGTASSWTFEEKSIPNVTATGSGSASLTFTMDTTDTKKLKITFSHTHTAPTLGTAIKVQSKSGGSNGTAPTLGTAIKVQSKSGGANGTAPTLGSKVPTVSASDVDVPIKNASASTFVTGTTHTITDNGHTHTI